MAHRGRLNALVHTVGRSYQSILREFEGERSIDALLVDPEGGTGDVKYHLPASGTRGHRSAGEIDVTIVPNPSHLEAADPVVEGRARAEQTDRSDGAGVHDPSVALPVLIHGDAAFPGQGVVAETLNLQSLEGYSTGGTLHLITNNQVGYTTDPTESRSTRYSSDLAKGFDVPIVHVNADDPEAALSAVRLAARLPDGVRPRLRDRPRRLPPLRPQRAGRRVVHAAADGRADPAAADRARRVRRAARRGRRAQRGREAEAFVDGGHGNAACGPRAAPQRHRQGGATAGRAPETVAPSRRRATRSSPPSPPTGCARSTSSCSPCRTAFTINAKLAKQLERRHEMIARGRDRLGSGRGARVRDRCSRTASRSASPARTPSAARSRTAISSSTTRTRARRTRRSSISRRRTRPSRSTTRRSPSTPRSASSTATRSPRPTRSCSGRRSSATSSTAPRS